MNEKFNNDIRDFVRELIKDNEFEDEIFLKKVNDAKEELKENFNNRKAYEVESCDESVVGIGDKTFIDIKGDSAMILHNKDEFNLLLRWDNSTLEDQFAINFGNLELGFQIYPKKTFGLMRDFVGFTISIDGVLGCSAFPVDLNFAEEGFYLSEDLDYKFEILLVEGKEGVVKAMRVVSMPEELCKVIRECYLKIKSDDYEEVEGVEDRINMQCHINKIGSEEAERLYGVYKMKNEIEVSKLQSYIKMV